MLGCGLHTAGVSSSGMDVQALGLSCACEHPKSLWGSSEPIALTPIQGNSGPMCSWEQCPLEHPEACTHPGLGRGEQRQQAQSGGRDVPPCGLQATRHGKMQSLYSQQHSLPEVTQVACAHRFIGRHSLQGERDEREGQLQPSGLWTETSKRTSSAVEHRTCMLSAQGYVCPSLLCSSLAGD